MDNRVVDYMKRINGKRLSLVEAKLMINEWNWEIVNYGRIKVAEALTYTEYDYASHAKYIDYTYGWTECISLEKSFKTMVKENNVWFETNLPEPVLFD